LAGCSPEHRKNAQTRSDFLAGQEDAFSMLQRSGIQIVRLVGPFERPVVLWRDGMTLAQAIVAGGYQEARNPAEILIQRGPTALHVSPDDLVGGHDLPLESGDVIVVLP